jgi:microcystin degradation protein MlrC
MMRLKMRIAVLQFAHETVTFLPNDTTREDFIYPGSPASGDALLATDPKGYMGGFVQVAREYEDVELIGITSPLWPRTGTGSGWITQDAYEHFLGVMIEELKGQSRLDGVYLALHGALAVRGVPRPEADIARRVRDAVGKDVVLSATFDPHGNEDEAFLEQADMAFTVKYFPHYDMHLQGERAARMLVRAIRGSFKPVHRTVRIPIIAPTVVMWTGASPWSDLIQRALIWEAREPDVFVNVFFGFPWSDVPDAGMGLQVLTNNDPGLADRVIRDMAEWIWRRREALLNTVKIHAMKQGVALASAAVAAGKAPVILADYSDRSGYATWLLQEIVAQKLERTLIATIASPDAVRSVLAAGAKPGDAFEAEIGGLFDESAGEPVRISGSIRSVSAATDGGGKGHEWVCVSFGKGNVLVLSFYLVQIMEPWELWQMGLKPEEFDIIAIKSRAHFRRGFDDSGFAPTILLVEPPEPFMGTVHLQALPYENLVLTDYYPYGAPSFPPADWT